MPRAKVPGPAVGGRGCLLFLASAWWSPYVGFRKPDFAVIDYSYALVSSMSQRRNDGSQVSFVLCGVLIVAQVKMPALRSCVV